MSVKGFLPLVTGENLKIDVQQLNQCNQWANFRPVKHSAMLNTGLPGEHRLQPPSLHWCWWWWSVCTDKHFWNQFLKFHVSCNRLRQKSGFSSINYHARDALDVGVHDIWCWYVDSRKSCVVWGVRLTAWYVNSSTLRWTWTHCSAVLTSLKPTVSWVSQVLMLSGKQSSILAAVWRCNLLPVVLRRHGHGYRDKVIHSSLTARWLCDL